MDFLERGQTDPSGLLRGPAPERSDREAPSVKTEILQSRVESAQLGVRQTGVHHTLAVVDTCHFLGA